MLNCTTAMCAFHFMFDFWAFRRQEFGSVQARKMHEDALRHVCCVDYVARNKDLEIYVFSTYRWRPHLRTHLLRTWGSLETPG